jgi:hypothetical protein
LAAWLRGIEFIKDEENGASLLQYMKEVYDIYIVSISDAAMEEEIALRATHLYVGRTACNDGPFGWTVDCRQVVFGSECLYV